MINAQRTGAYISKLRKGKDWTQQQLAEKLLVTHQAVSQWEKGASFPDIGLMPQLARLLGVSVDELLHGESQSTHPVVSGGAMVEALARGKPEDMAAMVRNDPKGVELMMETAPLAKPSQMNEVVGNLTGMTFTLEQVIDLAPFVSPERLQALLSQANAPQLEGETLQHLAPFLGREALDATMERLPTGALNLEQLTELAPFLTRERLAARLRPLLDPAGPLDHAQLTELAPFVGQELLGELLGRLPEGPLPMEFIVEVAPFVGRDALDGLLARSEPSAVVTDYLHELAPFLNKATLSQAVERVADRLTAKDILELAPFLERDRLETLIRKGTAR